MKRFLLFAGLYDNRIQGVFSLVSDFNSESLAKEVFEDGYAVGKYDWSQLFDLESRRIIAVSIKNGEWKPVNIGMSTIRKSKNDIK